MAVKKPRNHTIKNVLVTGCDGYIGTVLVPMLLGGGYKVEGIDVQYFNDCSIGTFPGHSRVHRIDVRSIDGIDLTGIDAIIHLAGLSNDPLGEINPELTEDINFTATVNLAKKAKNSGVKRFIFSSSCSVYGIADTELVDENSKTNPLTSYAKSKIMAEEELARLANQDFCVCLLRNSTVYGFSPKFREDLVVNSLTTTAVALGKILIKSDGTPWRPLIDVRDLARIFKEFLTVDADLVNGKAINIGFNDNNFQVKEIAEIVGSKLPGCEVVFTGEHGSDSRSYKVSFDRFQSIFPYIAQQWTLEKSVEDLIAHLQRNNYNHEAYNRKLFTRLEVLKRLMEKGKVDQNLYWHS